jgi:hypothetical protein
VTEKRKIMVPGVTHTFSLVSDGVADGATFLFSRFFPDRRHPSPTPGPLSNTGHRLDHVTKNETGGFPVIEELLPPQRVAEMLHTTVGRLANDRYMRKGPAYVKIGSKVLYRASDIVEYINAHVVTPDSAA